MKRAWQMIVLALVAALPAAAQNAGSISAGDLRGGKQAVRRPEGAESKPWLRFVQLPRGAPVRDLGAGQGALDLGSVSYLGGAVAEGVSVTRRARHLVISTVFGVTAGPDSVGTAELLACVTQAEALHRVFLDGVPLQLAPQVIRIGIKAGVVSEHRLQIEVPADQPETAAHLLSAIALQLVPQS